MGRLRNRLREQKHELKRALQEILAFATRDDLTGLANRRHMAELMGAEQARQRSGQSMSVVLVGIDFFKRINDTHGLRDALAETSFDSVAPGLRVTFSAALSICTVDDMLEATIERADQARYRAKTQGRNRTVSDQSGAISYLPGDR